MVWVALEETYQLVRADSIVSVAAVPVADPSDPRWDRTYPAKRLTQARRAQIMVTSSGGGGGCALTCEGRDAPQILAELVSLLAGLGGRDDGRVRYIRGRPRRSVRAWELVEELPEPEWALLAYLAYGVGFRSGASSRAPDREIVY